MSDLLTPKYETRHACRLARLTTDRLDVLAKRGPLDHVRSPTSKRGRLYSGIAIVQARIISECDDLNMEFGLASAIATAATTELLRDGEMDWDLLAPIKSVPKNGNRLTVVPHASREALPFLDELGAEIGDWSKAPVSAYTEYFEQKWLCTRREPTETGFGPIIPEQREILAREGIFAAPVIMFPLGEIVNGTLAMLRALDEREAKES